MNNTNYENQRNRWKASLWTLFGLEALLGLLCIIEQTEAAYGAGMILRGCIWIPLLMKHAYKERGTRLLVWVLIMSAITILTTVRNFIDEMNEPFSWVYLLDLGACIWFWVECLILREGNKKYESISEIPSKPSAQSEVIQTVLPMKGEGK